MSTPDRDPNRAKGRDSGEGSRRGQGSPESEQGSGGVLTNIQRRLGEAFCASRTDAVETGQNVPEAEPIPPQLPGGTQTVVPAAAGQTIPQFQSDVPGPSRQPGRDGTRPTAAQTLAAHVPERSPYNASVVSHQRRSKSPPTTRPNSKTQTQPQNSAEEWIRENAYERPARRQTGPEFVPAPVHVPPTPPPNETEHDYSTALDRWGRPITGAFVGRNLGGGHAANAKQKAYQQNPFAAFGQQSGLPRTSPTITAVNPPPPPANTRTGGFTALLNTGILDGTVPVGGTRARALSYDSQTNVILQGIQQTREQNPLRADSTDSQDTVREGELKSLASPDLSPEDRQLVIDRYLARRELETRQLLWHRGEYPRHASVRPEAEIMEAIDDEVDDIIKDMISGAKRNTSGPPEASLVHKAFQKQPEIEREFQNMIEVYKAFWRGVPRHINLNCNQDRDPFDCCWFLYFRKLALLSPENDDMREHYMLNRLRADIVRLCMKFIDTTLTRILSWPNFCRKILWDWRLENTRRAADGEYVINFPRGEDMDRLIRETGLTEQAIKSFYKGLAKRLRNDQRPLVDPPQHGFAHGMEERVRNILRNWATDHPQVGATITAQDIQNIRVHLNEKKMQPKDIRRYIETFRLRNMRNRNLIAEFNTRPLDPNIRLPRCSNKNRGLRYELAQALERVRQAFPTLDLQIKVDVDAAAWQRALQQEEARAAASPDRQELPQEAPEARVQHPTGMEQYSSRENVPWRENLMDIDEEEMDVIRESAYKSSSTDDGCSASFDPLDKEKFPILSETAGDFDIEGGLQKTLDPSRFDVDIVAGLQYQDDLMHEEDLVVEPTVRLPPQLPVARRTPITAWQLYQNMQEALPITQRSAQGEDGTPPSSRKQVRSRDENSSVRAKRQKTGETQGSVGPRSKKKVPSSAKSPPATAAPEDHEQQEGSGASCSLSEVAARRSLSEFALESICDRNSKIASWAKGNLEMEGPEFDINKSGRRLENVRLPVDEGYANVPSESDAKDSAGSNDPDYRHASRPGLEPLADFAQRLHKSVSPGPERSQDSRRYAENSNNEPGRYRRMNAQTMLDRVINEVDTGMDCLSDVFIDFYFEQILVREFKCDAHSQMPTNYIRADRYNILRPPDHPAYQDDGISPKIPTPPTSPDSSSPPRPPLPPPPPGGGGGGGGPPSGDAGPSNSDGAFQEKKSKQVKFSKSWRNTITASDLRRAIPGLRNDDASPSPSQGSRRSLSANEILRAFENDPYNDRPFPITARVLLRALEEDGVLSRSTPVAGDFSRLINPNPGAAGAAPPPQEKFSSRTFAINFLQRVYGGLDERVRNPEAMRISLRNAWEVVEKNFGHPPPPDRPGENRNAGTTQCPARSPPRLNIAPADLDPRTCTSNRRRSSRYPGRSGRASRSRSPADAPKVRTRGDSPQKITPDQGADVRYLPTNLLVWLTQKVKTEPDEAKRQLDEAVAELTIEIQRGLENTRAQLARNAENAQDADIEMVDAENPDPDANTRKE